MGWEHNTDTVWQAQELYCVERLSFDRVAEITGVSASTLKIWSQKMGWREKRAEIAQAQADIRVNIILGRKQAIDLLLTAKNANAASQMAFAVSSLESLALKQQELAQAGKIPSIIPKAKNPVIKSRAEAVQVLSEAVENKLGFALQNPEAINSGTIQDIAKMLKLMDELRASLPKTENAQEQVKRGLSEEVSTAMKKALGIIQE